jgi:acyl carrier protein
MRAIETEVREFVVENFLFGEGTDLTDTDSFLESAVLDSTGVLELVGFLENRYQITVEDRELVPANLDSVESVARFVQGKLHRKENSLAG